MLVCTIVHGHSLEVAYFLPDQYLLNGPDCDPGMSEYSAYGSGTLAGAGG